jgi:capsular exopolysaccharide synthesis family protein
MLRSRLYQARSAQQVKSIVITSAVTGEGKSFVAANLWKVFSLHPDRRVLLIDGDLTTPRLHKILGTCLTPGLTECLSQEVDLAEALQKGDGRNSFFMPAGDPPIRSSDLLSSGKLAPLLEDLASLFDWVIIDAPSALETSDACSLAENADGVLLVLRSSKTPSDIVHKALARFDENRVLGVVLNEVAGFIAAGGRVSSGEKHGA